MAARNPDPVIHLELHSGDMAAACSFLEPLCGWRARRVIAGAASYTALELGSGLGGGVVECPARRSIWLPYVQVPDVTRATRRARELGASVLLEPREGPAGWRSVVAAPGGGELAFWQARS
jgi:predicted enzyme related to lactoylglutathione lyase